MSTYRRPDGTADILPDQTPAWRALEDVVLDTCRRYGYLEIRPPLFEYTRLFAKASGDTTDVVEKQMFTVPSRKEGEDSFTFRPELTPGAIRAVIQGNLLAQKSLCKVFYMGPMFRYERPQKGRLRQFTQFGVEAIGSSDPLLDVETIAVLMDILRGAGIAESSVNVNTLGCPDCRGAYREVLRQAVQPRLAEWCENCRRRFDRNVFRIFDCKVPRDAEAARGLPAIADYVCAACKENFERVRKGLVDAGIPFEVDKRLVRGLDYYTRTVYEVKSARLGAQDALGGGGRYDGLVGQMGGPDVGAVGFAAGAERILLAQTGEAPALERPDFFVVAAGDEARAAVFAAAQTLRRAGLAGDLDFEGRSMKAQMRRANDLRARYVLIIGGDELARGVVMVKNMEDGSQRSVALAEACELIGRK